MTLYFMSWRQKKSIQNHITDESCTQNILQCVKSIIHLCPGFFDVPPETIEMFPQFTPTEVLTNVIEPPGKGY